MYTRSYRDLVVWQKSMDLVEEIYRVTKLLPKEEIFGIANQLRRAAISMPSNIAEGNKRNSQKDYARFLSIAWGSEAEIETQLEVYLRIGYFNGEQTSKASALCIEREKCSIQWFLNSITNRLSHFLIHFWSLVPTSYYLFPTIKQKTTVTDRRFEQENKNASPCWVLVILLTCKDSSTLVSQQSRATCRNLN